MKCNGASQVGGEAHTLIKQCAAKLNQARQLDYKDFSSEISAHPCCRAPIESVFFNRYVACEESRKLQKKKYRK